MVWAEDPETGERALKRVVRTFLNEKDELVDVDINDFIEIGAKAHTAFHKQYGYKNFIDIRTVWRV